MIGQNQMRRENTLDIAWAILILYPCFLDGVREKGAIRVARTNWLHSCLMSVWRHSSAETTMMQILGWGGYIPRCDT